MKDDPISKKKFKTLGFKKLDEQSIWTEHMKVKNQNLKLTQATDEPRIKRKQTDQIQKIYCTMNSPELTQASNEPRIKAPSSSGYLHDQSPDGSWSRVSSALHCSI